MAVGYATLYGDMAGGFAPIKDCTKTLVYRLARYRNALGAGDPGARDRRGRRQPNCAPDQKDSDSLPPYDVLDPILDALMLENRSVDGHRRRAASTAPSWRACWRWCAAPSTSAARRPPGVRISSRAFGRDWRYPITSGYRYRTADSVLDLVWSRLRRR